MIARSCLFSSIARDRRGRERNWFLKWLSVAAILLTSGHALYAQGAAVALFIDEKGNVGIGVIGMPMDKLEVAGNLRILTNGGNPIRFTSKWSGFPDSNSNQAEIANDTDDFKTLMIIGNN